MAEKVEVGPEDLTHLRRAVELAREGHEVGNPAVGSVITLNDEPIAEGNNTMIVPAYDPAWHAETTTMRRVPVELWPRAREMTCYSTLEPCIMCTTTLVMHGFGRVVFGSTDPDVGGTALLSHLPPYYEGDRGVPEWLGPCFPEECDPLRALCHELFSQLPVGSENL